MVLKLIQEYVSRLTLYDVESFAIKNGVSLNKSELNLVYKQIKENWYTIVYGNARGVLDEIKDNVSLATYQKIENLYIFFKDKFKNYL